MSAIFGIWHKSGEPIDEKHLLKMQSKISQYGRDAQDIYIDKNIGFGCCLNKWSKYSQEEVPVYQDARSETFLACDALIYNRDELIEKCCQTGNKEISTQELLLAAYKKWGEDCAKYINGDFTFAIWEKQKEQLLIFRDHLGVRPIYYYNSESTFAFSTDYRALLALPFVGKELNEKALFEGLTKVLNFKSEDTYFANIKALPQAHVLHINNRNISKYKYWTPGRNGKIKYKTEQEYSEALYSLVKDAIEIRIRNADKMVGAQLSGGLDSSVITILANRELAAKGQKMELFSWSPTYQTVSKKPNDERTLLEQVCAQENLTCILFDPDLSLENVDEIVPPDAVDLRIIRQECEILGKRGVKFVLSGWGGDQGISHRANIFELLINGHGMHFFREILILSKGSPLRLIKLIYANTIYQFLKPYGVFGYQDKKIIRFIKDDFFKRMRISNKEVLYFSLSPVKHLESGYIQTRTERSAWTDANHAIQHLYPFLDYRVIDFALSIPRYLYLRNGTSRYIYREAFREILPKAIYRFMSKDDIAKSTYFTSELPNTQKNINDIIGKLDQSIFSQYIDLNKLIDQITDISVEDKGNLLLIKKKILLCYSIQQITEDAKQRV